MRSEDAVKWKNASNMGLHKEEYDFILWMLQKNGVPSIKLKSKTHMNQITIFLVNIQCCREKKLQKLKQTFSQIIKYD